MKTLLKNIAKLPYYEIEDFKRDAEAYIEAIENRSMCCVISSVSASGMSRNISFYAFKNGNYRQFSRLFESLGYKENKKGTFTISGCGMDMIFYTNYNIIRALCKLDYITKEKCNVLEQMAPTILR